LDVKSFDWRSLKRYLEPKAMGDLNIFLENLPQNAGQGVLIAAAIAWAMAGALGIYTTMQTKEMTQMRAKFKETSAMTPSVPKISDVSVPKEEIEAFLEKSKDVYPNLSMSENGGGIVITAPSTANFTEFREALGHVQNGGQGWRVVLEKFCVGRECSDQFKLGASVKINKVSVENPAT